MSAVSALAIVRTGSETRRRGGWCCRESERQRPALRGEQDSASRLRGLRKHHRMPTRKPVRAISRDDDRHWGHRCACYRSPYAVICFAVST